MKYTIVDVLKIIKNQLNTIPVSGQHVLTMAGVFSNLETLIDTLTPQNEKEPSERDGDSDGGICP